jgi:hypothetical protein
METLPPLTVTDLDTAFQNPTFSTYIFVGDENDAGWDNAQIAFGLIPRLRIYRAERDNLLRPAWLNAGHPRGIVFDWHGNPVRFLTASEARDLKVVINGIKASRQT